MAARTAFNRAGPLLIRRSFSTAAELPVAELDKAYRASAQSFYNFPLDKIHFKVGSHFVHKTPLPALYFGDSKDSGLLHATPFAVATWSWFGVKGNFGRKLGYREGTVNDLEAAEQEVCISVEGLTGTGLNTSVKEYFAWLEAIQEKLLEHLLANQDAYPEVKAYVGGKAKKYDIEMVKDFLRSAGTGIVKTVKTDDPASKSKVPKPDSEFVQYKQKVYVKNAEAAKKGKIIIPEDEMMKAKGFARRHVPLFNSAGEEIDPTTASIRRGDIISVQNNLMANSYFIANRFGYGLRRNLRSVVLFQQHNSDFSKKSPFASLPTVA